MLEDFHLYVMHLMGSLGCIPIADGGKNLFMNNGSSKKKKKRAPSNYSSH